MIKLGGVCEKVVQPWGLETSLRNIVWRDGVSFNRTDQRYYVQRNPANEIWWKSRQALLQSFDDFFGAGARFAFNRRLQSPG